MIKNLRDTYSYTPEEIKDKLNEVIDKMNELDGKEAAMKMYYKMDVDSTINKFLFDHGLKDKLVFEEVLARPVK